jgi:hypothetical protein
MGSSNSLKKLNITCENCKMEYTGNYRNKITGNPVCVLCRKNCLDEYIKRSDKLGLDKLAVDYILKIQNSDKLSVRRKYEENMKKIWRKYEDEIDNAH